MFLRTAKSCDPDAPTLASSSRRQVGPTGLRHAISADDGGKQARSPGRARRKPLKPLRAGMPGDSGVLVVTRVRSTTIIAHETAGALGIRHSPRPRGGGDFMHSSGAFAPRDRERMFVFVVIARSETKQSILCFAREDGSLRGACHQARIRATRN